MNHELRKIAFFGHFGRDNFGNEATLQAMLCNLRRLAPNVEFTCVCTDPERVARDYGINATPNRNVLFKPWVIQGRLARLARALLVGIPVEFYRWLKGLKTLWGTDVLIVPGTGLLTDAYTLFNWGPYEMFRWSATAKLCRSKLLFVSVGAGPLYSRVGRFFVKASLTLADFRSYRDETSRQFLKGIGFRFGNDSVSPDLAFSLPVAGMPRGRDTKGRRLIVGLGLMEYAGRYSVERPTNAVYPAYLETLVEFVRWLLAHEYDVRLLIGALADTPTTGEFKALLKERGVVYGQGRIIDEPVASFEAVLSQIAATDFMIATRFHNLLFSVLLNKPSISISFHHKCTSLMSQMGLSEYCQDINHMTTAGLIEQFYLLEKNAETVKQKISEKVTESRNVLDEQYRTIFNEFLSD